MKRKLFQSMFCLVLALMLPSVAVFYYMPRSLEALLWLLLALALVGALLSQVLAGRITARMMRTLRDANLEDLETQGIYEELRPLASRVLEQNRQMQKQLQKQNIELRREFEKQDRMRRDFTANVSHELKTPLTSISGYAEIIRNGLVREEDIGHCAGKMYDEAQRMIALVEDILKLSQLEEGYPARVERGPVELCALCRRVLGRLQGAAEQLGIRISFSGEEADTMGLAKIVEEILYNLVDNAIKYNRPEGEIDVSLRKRGDKIVLAVRDTGIGISEEEQVRVFERFYRVDKSHSKEIGGTGLGLSIVKHGALYHDARLELESTLGEGTEFRVLFQQMETLTCANKEREACKKTEK